MEKICLNKNPRVIFRGFQYDPQQKVPAGFNARTTSQGPQCMFTRDDGVMFHAAPMDWMIAEEGTEAWIVLSSPAFQELFSVVD